MPKSLHEQYPLLSNTLADIRLIGMPSVLNPYANQTSSARANMFASHISQAMLIKGGELPYQFTGVEYDLGTYEYNNSRRLTKSGHEQDAEILAVIPKYVTSPGFGVSRIRSNPHLLVIYRGMEDNQLHYFTVDRYTKGTDGFGYENTWLNTHRLYDRSGGPIYLPKEVKLVTSPAHKGSKYCLGTNLNCAYMTMMDTIDDAMLISESAAAKLETTELATVLINIGQASRPVNLYGDENEIKAIPDIGEIVGPHGYLCALRPMHTDTYAADLDPQALLTPRPEIDDITTIKPGSTIVDIDYVFNPQRRNFGSYISQMEKYTQGARIYWDAVLDTATKYRHIQMSPAFSTLIHTAISRALMLNPGRAKRDFKLKTDKFEIEGVIRKQPVDFIQIVVTYMLPRPVNKAFKVTDRFGGKGVICRICPDDEMPVDANGIRADLVIDPKSPNARMNFGTITEPLINRISEQVRRKCAELLPSNPQAAVATLMDWYNDVNPNYGALIRRTLSDDELLTHVKESVAGFIHLLIPPFLDTITPENLDMWATKWGVEITPVTYSLHDRHGNKRTYTTKYPVLIGAKYMYCLAKLPYPTSAGISHVSHYGIPSKPAGNTKHRFATRMTPVKFGEDEIRVLSMDVPEEEVARLLNLQSNSPKGMRLMVDALLTAEFPTAIRRINISNEELARTSAVTAMFHHTTSVLGMETRNTLTTMEPPKGLRNDSQILGNNDIKLGSGFSDGSEGGDRDDERWLAAATIDSDDIGDGILEDIDAIAEELGLVDDPAEAGVEDLLDVTADIIDDGLASGIEGPQTEDDVDPLHDPNVDN